MRTLRLYYCSSLATRAVLKTRSFNQLIAFRAGRLLCYDCGFWITYDDACLPNVQVSPLTAVGDSRCSCARFPGDSSFVCCCYIHLCVSHFCMVRFSSIFKIYELIYSGGDEGVVMPSCAFGFRLGNVDLDVSLQHFLQLFTNILPVPIRHRHQTIEHF